MNSQIVLVIFSVYIVSSCLCGVVDEHWKNYTYKEETLSFYKIHNTRRSWSEAKEICESEDALLFYPDSEEEAEMVRRWWGEFSSGNMTPRASPFIHIGVIERGGQYETVDGISINKVYHKWSTEELNRKNQDDNCGQLQYDLTINNDKCNGMETDYDSSQFYLPFLCKKSLSSNKDHSGFLARKEWKDYSYIKETRSFYKAYKTYVSWTEAKTVCETDGAFLFYPNTREEAELVREWWGNYTSEDVESRSDVFIHIGLTDFNREQDFHTVDGIPINEVYHKWSKGEPNNAKYSDEYEDCVNMYYNLYYNDGKCNCAESESPFARCRNRFICKRKDTSGIDNSHADPAISKDGVCNNFCFAGNCTVSENGQPVCSCMHGYSGLRCTSVCHNYCKNNGSCTIDTEMAPVCQCEGAYEGSRCEKLKDIYKEITVHEEIQNCKKYVITIVLLVLILLFFSFCWLTLYCNWFANCRQKYKCDALPTTYVHVK